MSLSALPETILQSYLKDNIRDMHSFYKTNKALTSLKAVNKQFRSEYSNVRNFARFEKIPSNTIVTPENIYIYINNPTVERLGNFISFKDKDYKLFINNGTIICHYKSGSNIETCTTNISNITETLKMLEYIKNKTVKFYIKLRIKDKNITSIDVILAITSLNGFKLL